jgi:phosphate/sulfate permease
LPWESREARGFELIAWIVTMPAAAIMAALAYYLGRLIL